jgi:hypothetical protein
MIGITDIMIPTWATTSGRTSGIWNALSGARCTILFTQILHRIFYAKLHATAWVASEI